MQQIVKGLILGGVRSVFHDKARGEAPVPRREDGLFGPQSVAWRVHGDLASMMVGGVAALLMQMLHPKVLAGVWDHSSFREDMLGRLRRTARFIAVTTYGSRGEAEAAIARVRQVHRRVHGTLPDGRPYSAADPDLLAWVHVSESLCFLDSWRRYGEPGMSAADQDRYFAETVQVPHGLGAQDLPTSRAETLAYIETTRPRLRVDTRTREVARILLNQPAQNAAMWPVQQLTFQAAVDLLPTWARRMHGLRSSGLTRPLVLGGTRTVAEMLRWAFR